MKIKIIVLSIIILAFFLRFFYLDQVPAGFDPDEAEFAFNSYTLSKYLVNENNQFLPFEVNTYGNFRPLALPYLIAVSLKLFGNTVFAVRAPNAAFGVLSVVLMYFFVKTLCKKTRLALLSSFLMGFSPWSVFLSRGTAEPVMALCFILLMFIFIIKFWERGKIKHLFFIYFSAFIGFFTYTGVLPLVFLMSGALILYLFFKTKKIHWKIIFPFVFLIVFPILIVYKTTPGYLNGRFKQTSLLEEKGQFGIKLVTEEQIRENGYNRAVYQNSITQFFHNMPVNTLNAVLINWTKHFSFDYLYFKGGEPNRLQVPNVGVFLLIEFVFLTGGSLFLFRHAKFNLFFLAILLILIGFLPAGLTFEEVPSTHRPIFASIGFFLIESYFLYWLAKKLKSLPFKLLCVVMFLIFAYEMSFYLHNYLVLEPRHKNWFRHAEMYEVAYFIRRNINKYDKIYVVKNSVEPAYFYYFFNNLDPMPIILNANKNHSGTWVDGKITYVNESCADFENPRGTKVLIIERTECENGGALIREVLTTDGTKSLKIISK